MKVADDLNPLPEPYYIVVDFSTQLGYRRVETRETRFRWQQRGPMGFSMNRMVYAGKVVGEAPTRKEARKIAQAYRVLST